MSAAALAAGDPPAARIRREARDRHGVALRSAGTALSRGRGDKVYRLVEKQHAAGALVGGLRRRVASVLLIVPEDDRDVDVTSSEHPQSLGRLGLREHELQARRPSREARRRCRDERAEGGRERGKPDSAAPQADMGG